MIQVPFPLGGGNIELSLPDNTDVLGMTAPEPLSDPGAAIRAALESPIASPPLGVLARKALARPKGERPLAVILVSDNTRPVPYSGESGILLPIVKTLLKEGFAADDIAVIAANGTHRPMAEDELKVMLDAEIWKLGVRVLNHNCRDEKALRFLGTTPGGSEVYINSLYLDADLKIATGLVESHFMAGFSGGRKSVCPGIIGEKSTFIFHGAAIMGHPESRDLNLEGNPCHEEALETARMAGVDFIVNVTLDHSFRICGVFAGGLEEAHKAAAEKVKSYVGIPAKGYYDIVVSHGGFVGVNHYQIAKVAVASLGLLKKDGYLIVAGNNTDAVNRLGSPQYRTCLRLLRQIGSEAFVRLIKSPDWVFLPDQWQVQMWAKLFERIPQDHFYYFSPQLDERHWEELPGVNGGLLLPEDRRARPGLEDVPGFVASAINAATASCPDAGRAAPRIAWLSDGPYGIPYQA
ncbi:MAG: nickel-dependent lactate racemase [Spirochaetaceae bacterium]|jgi:nickel-dependent lactate racemase|nr:nickel-dependent lactate racemase [Spirochaetaceae bacterium]